VKAYLATQYLEAGCNFAQESPMPFVGVHGVTGGRVCDTGCAEFSGGKCPAYRALTATATAPVHAVAVETVREEAARRGLSISEIRRQRRAVT
jgi:hypothetical protein